ncbi:hypothetical protein [Paraoerskovia marina]|uniref:hypothetical protein n=1 Tax=Paraoerskovia marina TaxID=545619 RepID=UPI0012F90CD3|nr:hypothetical protein [Paraoerskovia marina]
MTTRTCPSAAADARQTHRRRSAPGRRSAAAPGGGPQAADGRWPLTDGGRTPLADRSRTQMTDGTAISRERPTTPLTDDDGPAPP